jgi:hypothetical protein
MWKISCFFKDNPKLSQTYGIAFEEPEAREIADQLMQYIDEDIDNPDAWLEVVNDFGIILWERHGTVIKAKKVQEGRDPRSVIRAS